MPASEHMYFSYNVTRNLPLLHKVLLVWMKVLKSLTLCIVMLSPLLETEVIPKRRQTYFKRFSTKMNLEEGNLSKINVIRGYV